MPQSNQGFLENLNPTNILEKPDAVGAQHVGRNCVVAYEHKPYPGLILDVEHGDNQVKCMACIGENRFRWPSLKDDMCWYSEDEILCVIL